MMLEQLPVAPQNDADAKTYRTHRVSRDLQIWFTEGRMYRSPNAAPDDADKSLWGVEQREWLQRTLQESDATYKLLISPTPLIGPDDLRKTDNHCDVGGFRHERDAFFQWLVDTGIAEQGFAIICGDRHWQYHSIHPSGIEEFSCGALVDANSRPGRRPGDPLSTDPDATIRQDYAQDTPSGGFLMVRVTPDSDGRTAGLTFQWYEERGELLHKIEK
jgi:alkaline phosphatase/alkaline phosphatase D